jgi:heat shock protein HslJ/membrane-bound inhibitor of C-type lysozyme
MKLSLAAFIRLQASLGAPALLMIACTSGTATLPSGAAPGLGGTSWQLVKFESGDGKVLTPDDPAKYTVAFGADGSVSARIDCNRGRGTWKSSGPNQLELGQLALTRALCPPGSLHDRIVKDWLFVRSYTLKDGNLFLALMADAGIYELAPLGGAKANAPDARVAATGPIEFDCTGAEAGGEKIFATFYKTDPAMVLVERAGRSRPAFQVPAASGAKYEAAGLMFWDARGEALVTWSGVELKCKRR